MIGLASYDHQTIESAQLTHPSNASACSCRNTSHICYQAFHLQCYTAIRGYAPEPGKCSRQRLVLPVGQRALQPAPQRRPLRCPPLPAPQRRVLRVPGQPLQGACDRQQRCTYENTVCRVVLISRAAMEQASWQVSHDTAMRTFASGPATVNSQCCC